MKNCKNCKNFNKEFCLCQAELWEDYPLRCYLTMIIQELRMSNCDDSDGEEWKFPVS